MCFVVVGYFNPWGYAFAGLLLLSSATTFVIARRRRCGIEKRYGHCYFAGPH
jgi:hypothetical protein